MKDNLEMFISGLSVLISALTLIITRRESRKYDNKIKKLDIQIKEYENQKNLKEELESKKAIIDVSFVPNVEIYDEIVIKNNGQAPAENVKIIIEKDDSFFVEDFPEGLNLKSNKSYSSRIYLSEGYDSVIVVIVEWDDGLGNHKDTFDLYL